MGGDKAGHCSLGRTGRLRKCRRLRRDADSVDGQNGIGQQDGEFAVDGQPGDPIVAAERNQALEPISLNAD